MLTTLILAVAVIFPIVNPLGSALVFLSMTKRASVATRTVLARRVAINSFFVMMISLLAGPFILKIYGISIPLLRLAGGLVVAAAGWKLLNEGGEKDASMLTSQSGNSDYSSMTFFPMTMPLTTGPGTIAVLISLGFSQERYSNAGEEFLFLAIVLLAASIIAFLVYICFAYSHWVQKALGRVGADIALRLSAFILFCLGIQIMWSGISVLLPGVLSSIR